MKKLILIILAATAVLVAAVLGSSRLIGASPSPAAAAAPAAKSCGPPDVAMFGYVKSLKRAGDHFELRFDPAWFTSGVTANQAALEDTGSSDVPNDNYIVDEGHRLLTYLVPATSHITVLSSGQKLDERGFASQSITAAQLAQLVEGRHPVKLFEALDTGFWMHVSIDTVCSLEQQYQP
jgi:hypothetical protein